MASFTMQSSTSLQTSVQSRAAPAPFRANRTAPHAQRAVVTKAQQEPTSGAAKKAAAAFAAAAIALTPFSADATESGIMPSRNRAEDNAARSFLDSKEKKGPAVQSRSSDPNSGNVDTEKIAGVSQADKRTPAGRLQKSDPNNVVPMGEQIASLNSQTTKGPNTPGARKAEAKLDAGAALKAASDRSGPKPVAWDLTSLQTNVATPDLGALVDKAKAGADKAAGAAKEATGNASGPLQSAAGDAKSAAGDAKQGLKDLKKQPNVAFDGVSNGLQVNVAAPSLGGLADKAKAGVDKAAGAAKEATGNAGGPLQGAKGDAKSALGSAKQGVKDLKKQPNVAWNGVSNGLHVNVAAPSLGGLAHKAKAGVDKAAGAAKEATGNAGGPLQGAKGDAKSALGSAKQGVKDLKKQPNVSWNGSYAGLQVNVGQTTFGRGEVGTFKDQANDASKDIKENLSNPIQSTKNAASRTGQAAERVLSNPTGGPEQSKRAAQQLSDANAEIPRALSGGVKELKDAVTP